MLNWQRDNYEKFTQRIDFPTVTDQNTIPRGPYILYAFSIEVTFWISQYKISVCICMVGKIYTPIFSFFRKRNVNMAFLKVMFYGFHVRKIHSITQNFLKIIVVLLGCVIVPKVSGCMPSLVSTCLWS